MIGFKILCGALADDDAGSQGVAVVTRGMIDAAAIRRFAIP